MSFDFDTCHQDASTKNPTQEPTDPIESDSSSVQYGVQYTSRSVSRKGKSRRAHHRIDPNAPCFIRQLSVELLVQVFTRLDPVSLAQVAKVCHHWRHIVNDDSCWKDAFLDFFGQVPFKRLQKDSWKSEYILRTHLLRKWRKGRGTVIQFNPKVGPIDDLTVDLENASMLVVSAAHGMAVRCNPANGKVDRHALFSTDDGVPLRVNVVRIEGQRILWGFTQGFITMSIRTKPLVVRQLRVFADFHQGPVSALALPAFLQDTVLSAGDDGAVKLWDVARSSCVETLIGIVNKPTCLEVLRDNRVVAGYSNGVIVVWNIHVGQIMKRHRDRQPREEMDSAAQRLVISPTVPETSTPVTRILHDGNSNSILASHEGSQEVRRYDLTSGTCIAVFGDGHPLGNITCMEWDTAQPVDSLSLDIALKLRGPKTNAKEAAILASYKSDNGFKSTRLLVTGDASGLICLWDGDAVPAQEGGVIKPLRVLDEHTGSISALFIDAAKVISGSDDGWIRVWDPLTGYLVNVMGNKIPRHAPIDRNDISLTRVSRICCDDYRGVANVGHEIKTWDFSPEKQLLARRNLKPKGRSTVAEARHHHYELKQDIRESKDALKEEKIERENMAKKVHTQSLGGLSDEEMLAYAMMLSQEENAQKQQPFIQREDYIEGDDDEVMQAIIASLEDQTMDESPGGGSGSSSGSGTNSALHTQSTSPEPSSSGGDGDIGYEDSYHEELERWPPVNDSDKDRDARQWQRPGFVDEDDDENDEELQYVLKLSRGEI